MKSNHEIQNTPLKYTKFQNQKTCFIFNYHSTLITKLPTYLNTPILTQYCCLIILYVVKNKNNVKTTN